MTVSPAERWFEDYHVGMVDEFGKVAVTAEELIAGGWHTASMAMRLFAEHYRSPRCHLPASMNWLQ